MKRLRLVITCTLIAGLIGETRADQGQQGAIDGFNAYCTSNMDATGACFNEENNSKMNCIVVPGSIIDCKSKKGKTYQCVWTSNVTANQAQFWCDPNAEMILGEDLDENIFKDDLDDK